MPRKRIAGTQRIDQDQHYRDRKAAREALAAHLAYCPFCRRARNDPYAWCDDGWELAKAEAHASSEVEKDKKPEITGQYRLW